MGKRLFARIPQNLFALMAAVVLTSGCGVATTGNGTSTELRHVPTPVQDHGDTLNWGADVKSAALRMIQSSQTYCYLDIYELSDPDVLQALTDAKNRGIDVRVIVDATEQHSQTVAVPTLKHQGVHVLSLKIPRGISHIKMLAADGSAGGVLIGGMNFGEHSWDNNDASVYIPNPNSSFLATFRWDWQRASGNAAAEPSAQLPFLNERSTKQHVVASINRATSSVFMEAFNLSDSDVVHALTSASRRGVLVEVLLDANQAQNKETANLLRESGVTVRFYSPYGNEWMHAKILDIDNGSTFIIGSANFSHQAYTYNHEGDLELHGFSGFDKAFKENLSLQISRGTDYPRHKKP